MQLDIRIPIGLMFGLLGIILTFYGWVTASNTAMYEHSLGININLWCGLIFVAFAGLMLALAMLGLKPAKDQEPNAPQRNDARKPN